MRKQTAKQDEAEMFIDQNAVDPLGGVHDEVAGEEAEGSDDPINPENTEETVTVKRTKKRKRMRKQVKNRTTDSAKKAAVDPSEEQFMKSDSELMSAQVVNVTTLRTIQRNATTSIIMPEGISENTTALRDLLRCTRIVKSASSSGSEMSAVNSYVGSAPKEDQNSESVNIGDSADTVTTLRGIKRKIIHPVTIPEAISSENKRPLCELLRRTRIVKTVESSGPDRIINCSYESSDDNETVKFQESEK